MRINERVEVAVIEELKIAMQRAGSWTRWVIVHIHILMGTYVYVFQAVTSLLFNSSHFTSSPKKSRNTLRHNMSSSCFSTCRIYFWLFLSSGPTQASMTMPSLINRLVTPQSINLFLDAGGSLQQTSSLSPPSHSTSHPSVLTHLQHSHAMTFLN